MQGNFSTDSSSDDRTDASTDGRTHTSTDGRTDPGAHTCSVHISHHSAYTRASV